MAKRKTGRGKAVRPGFQFRTSRERLEKLRDEAVVDCYGEDEQRTGLATSVVDGVACRFSARVSGEDVEVTSLEEQGEAYDVRAICQRNGETYRIGLDSLEFVEPYPEGYEWIEVYWIDRNGYKTGS